MKTQIKHVLASMFALACLMACSYDDADIKEDIADLQNRVTTLEDLVTQLNSDIVTLQDLYVAMIKQTYVSSVSEVDGGYMINFSDGSSVTIYDGSSAEDGSVPVIGISQDEDGNYYWTLDGEWMTDEDGNKIKAVGSDGSTGETGDDGADGADGEDGNVPILSVDDDGWLLVSYDNGETWVSLNWQVAVTDGEDTSLFASVEYDDYYVYITLNDDDNTVLTLLMGGRLSLSLDVLSAQLSPGGTISLSYTLTGGSSSTEIATLCSDGFSAVITPEDYSSGTIDITAPSEVIDGTVAVFASDGESTTVMKVVTILMEEGVLTVTDNTIEMSGAGGTVEISVSTNVDYEISIPENAQDWISYVETKTVREDVVCLYVTANTGSVRSAVVTLTPSDNTLDDVTVLISQLSADAATFTEVRAMSEGVLDDDRYIEGYIVSDIESMNVCSAPQTGQFAFDRTENEKTSYIESTDGKYGFALKFDSEDDNTLERYSLVQISLSGLTLEVNEDPEYYTLSGLTASSIISAGDPDEDAVPVKEKTIAELTDDDIFTLTSVTGLEIFQKDGSYTNCSDGYSYKDAHNSTNGSSTAPRWDVAPLLCHDAEGETIFMLTNAGVSWRRDGTDCGFYGVVPQGSGTFKGIVVADTTVVVRFGDCGRYQLRAMVEDDIDLNDDPFTNTIVEWTWDDQIYDLTPETGTGSISIYGSAYTAASNDYNNTTSTGYGGASSEQKGLVANAGIYIYNYWWDFDNDEGAYFDVSFSTEDISGSNMMFGIVFGHGKGNTTSISNPDHWNVLYSVDGGSTFDEVPDAELIKIRSIVWWTTTAQDSCPGYTEHLVKLPSECFGKESVVVRLQAADTVCDISPTISSTEWWNNLSVEKGTMTSPLTLSNCFIRIGTISVRYN